MGRVVHWPDARTLALRSLLRSGQSDSAIADALGVSVRAVIGKRQRLRLFRMPQRDGDPLTAAIHRAGREAAQAITNVVGG